MKFLIVLILTACYTQSAEIYELACLTAGPSDLFQLISNDASSLQDMCCTYGRITVALDLFTVSGLLVGLDWLSVAWWLKPRALDSTGQVYILLPGHFAWRQKYLNLTLRQLVIPVSVYYRREPVSICFVSSHSFPLPTHTHTSAPKFMTTLEKAVKLSAMIVHAH